MGQIVLFVLWVGIGVFIQNRIEKHMMKRGYITAPISWQSDWKLCAVVGVAAIGILLTAVCAVVEIAAVATWLIGL